MSLPRGKVGGERLVPGRCTYHCLVHRNAPVGIQAVVVIVVAAIAVQRAWQRSYIVNRNNGLRCIAAISTLGTSCDFTNISILGRVVKYNLDPGVRDADDLGW